MVATARQTSPKKLAAYGAILTLLGGGVFFSLDSLLNMALKSQLNLDPNGPLFETWKKAPLAATYKFYVFNIDNPEEALRGQKLRVSERGPFTFSQWRRKEIIGWAPDKSTVSYYEYKTYFFEPSQTVGSMDEELVILNPLVAVSFFTLLHYLIASKLFKQSFGATISRITKEDLPIPMVLSPFIYGTINGLLGIHRESLFSRQTVRELLFGKRVGLLDTITTLMRPLDLFGIKLESFPKDALPPNNTVGLLYGKNDTAEGPYEVYTGLGAKGGPTFSFASWQGRTKLKWWKTEKCNMINGSDGSLFKPGLTKDEILYAFGPDICSLKFIQESSYMGIPTYKYSFPENFLVGIEKNPENDCFCIHKDKAKCRVDGIYDLGGCQYGAPLVLTTPHFFAAPHLGKLVDGLTPNEEAHGTFVEIQPVMISFSICALLLLNTRYSSDFSLYST
ncbi:platelet glycoprotein 4-like protein [Dinothrombium tinctorium]|uniref:Platelet glycoprotein 4-like protein n=1 Tax=Dinothrombium tinctorium TaxID=1965070 RepID=A0A3S3P5Y4_9ACAR|nr:platelet glycoprotein 4-like protein [Dinothrombium tinctorium]